MNAHELQAAVERGALLLFALMMAYLVSELILLHFGRRRLRLREARACGIGLVANAVVAALMTSVVGFLSVGVAALAGASLSPMQGGLSWPWWVYGLVVYEFWYWLQHWAAHKVRLLWCIHSPHHGPGSIHVLVGTNHHFLESLFYFPIFLGFLPALFGVPPLICVVVNVIDGLWGNFLHISDEVVRRGRYGVLERFLQTPSYHRVHHGRNPLYMDTNYNSITLLWDWLFGTLQPLRDDEPVRFGVTRAVDTGSYWDLHFGEFRCLWRDLVAAVGWNERLGLLFRPPGWAPQGAGHTVADAKRELATASRSAAVR